MNDYKKEFIAESIAIKEASDIACAEMIRDGQESELECRHMDVPCGVALLMDDLTSAEIYGALRVLTRFMASCPIKKKTRLDIAEWCMHLVDVKNDKDLEFSDDDILI